VGRRTRSRQDLEETLVVCSASQETCMPERIGRQDSQRHWMGRKFVHRAGSRTLVACTDCVLRSAERFTAGIPVVKRTQVLAGARGAARAWRKQSREPLARWAQKRKEQHQRGDALHHNVRKYKSVDNGSRVKIYRNCSPRSRQNAKRRRMARCKWLHFA